MTMDAASYWPPEGLKFPQPAGEPTPDWEEVRQQDQPTMRPVPVEVKGFVPVWNLPAKSSTVHKHQVDTLVNKPQGQLIVDADPRLKRAWISSGIAFTYGTQEQIVTTKGMDGFDVPIGLPIPLEGVKEPIYAMAAAPGFVSVRYEYWAD